MKTLRCHLVSLFLFGMVASCTTITLRDVQMQGYTAKPASIEAVCLYVSNEGTTFHTSPTGLANASAFFQQAVSDAVRSVLTVKSSTECERMITVEMKMLHSYTRINNTILPTIALDYQVLLIWTITGAEHTPVKILIPSRRWDTDYALMHSTDYVDAVAIREVIYDGLDRSLPWLLCSLENPTCEIPDFSKEVEKIDLSNAEVVERIKTLKAIGEPESVTRIGSWQLW